MTNMKTTIATISIASSMLGGCSTLGGLDTRSFAVVRSYCDAIPDSEKNMRVEFELVSGSKRGKTDSVSITCTGMEPR